MTTVLPSLLLLLLLLWAVAAKTAAIDAADSTAKDSIVANELLGQSDDRQQRRWPTVGADGSESPDFRRQPDPYDEFAEPRRLDWPSSRRSRSRSRQAERIRRRVLWRISRHPDLTSRQRELERLSPMKPHSRDERLDRPDPYSEYASAAYYRFVKAILDMRNGATALSGFDETSAIKEFFEDIPPSSNSSSTPAPPGPTMTPSPPVQVCPPRWRLGDHRCETNATFCYKDAECPGSRCCFDGCKLRCLEPELLIKHVCRDYMNSSVFPGDLYMHGRSQICTCDEFGRPTACKDKKPCIDIISSSLFKLPLISNETVKPKKKERTTRKRIYDALQEAFKHVKKVY